MTDYSVLPLLERMKAYRDLAVKALDHANASDSKVVREHYLFIAAQWDELVKDVELRLARGEDRRAD